MDAALEPGKMPFVWPLDVVHDVGLKQREIAVVAWTSYEVGPVVQQVYVPVVVASGSSSVPQGSSPRISLLPGRELNEIFLSVQSLDPNLVPTKTLLKDYPLGEGPYYAEVPLSLDVQRLKIGTPGFYSVKIGATVDNGTPTTLFLILYYANF